MYRLTQAGGVIRVEDGAYVPNDVDNTDWQAYLGMVSAGRHLDLPQNRRCLLLAKPLRPAPARLARRRESRSPRNAVPAPTAQR
jgi:hypothetical protein